MLLQQMFVFSFKDKSLKAEKDLELWTGFQIYLFLHSTHHSNMYFTFILKEWNIIFSNRSYNCYCYISLSKLKVACNFPFLAFISLSLLPNTINWLIINKTRLFFLVTHNFLLGDEIFCDFRLLCSVKNTCPVTRFRGFMKCYP